MDRLGWCWRKHRWLILCFEFVGKFLPTIWPNREPATKDLNPDLQLRLTVILFVEIWSWVDTVIWHSSDIAFRDLTVGIIGLDIWSSVCVHYNVIQCLAVLVFQFQAITWGILSLLGILIYTGYIEGRRFPTILYQFQWTLVHMYFVPSCKCMA